MRYNVEDIEDQILTTLTAHCDLTQVNIRTHTGEVNARIFLDDQAASEFIALLPFVLVQYQGKRFTTSDTAGRMYINELTFRFYIGAQNLRSRQEGQRSAYAMLRAVFDSIHGKVPLSTPQQLTGWQQVGGTLEGPAITTTNFNPQTGILAAPGLDERLIVNLPGVVVYATDYIIRVQT